MSIIPQELQNLFDELEASRASRKRAWDNLQEIRCVLKDSTGVQLPGAARKTIDLEGRIVKDGVRKALRDRQQPTMKLNERPLWIIHLMLMREDFGRIVLAYHRARF